MHCHAFSAGPICIVNGSLLTIRCPETMNPDRCRWSYETLHSLLFAFISDCCLQYFPAFRVFLEICCSHGESLEDCLWAKPQIAYSEFSLRRPPVSKWTTNDPCWKFLRIYESNVQMKRRTTSRLMYYTQAITVQVRALWFSINNISQLQSMQDLC